MLDLGAVTTALLSSLAGATPVPVGDGIAPAGAGWPEGTPNSASAFVPYGVLSALSTSALSSGMMALCGTFASRFDVTYRLSSYDNTRSLADSLAADLRESLVGAVVTGDVGDDLSLTGQIWLDAVTGATRDDSTYPQMWSASTTFRVSVAKR